MRKTNPIPDGAGRDGAPGDGDRGKCAERTQFAPAPRNGRGRPRHGQVPGGQKMQNEANLEKSGWDAGANRAKQTQFGRRWARKTIVKAKGLGDATHRGGNSRRTKPIPGGDGWDGAWGRGTDVKTNNSWIADFGLGTDLRLEGQLQNEPNSGRRRVGRGRRGAGRGENVQNEANLPRAPGNACGRPAPSGGAPVCTNKAIASRQATGRPGARP